MQYSLKRLFLGVTLFVMVVVLIGAIVSGDWFYYRQATFDCGHQRQIVILLERFPVFHNDTFYEVWEKGIRIQPRYPTCLALDESEFPGSDQFFLSKSPDGNTVAVTYSGRSIAVCLHDFGTDQSYPYQWQNADLEAELLNRVDKPSQGIGSR